MNYSTTKDKIKLARDFLKEHLFVSDVDEADKVYRYELSIRADHLGKMLVEKEAYDDTILLLSRLLHDVSKFDSPSEIATWTCFGQSISSFSREMKK